MMKYEGWWWLSDSPEYKLPGTLTVNPSQYSILSLLGGWEKIQESRGRKYRKKYKDVPTIYGISAEGTPITLEGCSITRMQPSKSKLWPNHGINGLSKQEFYCSTVITGEHLNPDNLLRSITIEFTHMDSFVGFHTMEENKNEPNEITADLFKVDIGSNTMIALNSSIISFFNVSVGYTSERMDRFVISNTQGLSLKQAKTLLQYLQDFLILATGGQYVRLKTIKYSVVGKSPLTVLRQSAFFGTPNIYFSDIDYDSEKDNNGSFFRSLFIPVDIVNEFPNALQNFIDKGQDYELAFDLYFTLVKKNIFSDQHRFLSYVQAVEGLHNRIYNTKSERVYLKDRIKKVIEKYPENTKSKLWGEKMSREEFIKGIVEIRNYLSHGGARKPEAYKQLALYINKLKVIVEICLLEMMGLSHEKIISLISLS